MTMRMISRRRLLATTACAALGLGAAISARAADVIFPPASRIGLAPPAGFTISREFSGFEDRARKAAILFAELPPEAYAQVEKNAATEILKAGATIESNE